jgi:hypothetical protein
MRPTSGPASCPTCRTRRVGSFRYCLSCGYDYEPQEPAEPATGPKPAAVLQLDLRPEPPASRSRARRAGPRPAIRSRRTDAARSNSQPGDAATEPRRGWVGALVAWLENGDTLPVEWLVVLLALAILVGVAVPLVGGGH